MAILSSEEQEKITHAISLAENRTSGEIRVVVENVVGEMDVFEKATKYFNDLRMHNTSLRNGVLIYIAVADHQFAIVGDQGINDKVGDTFWNQTKDFMITHFKQGNYCEGLLAGIHQIGECLQDFFPRQEDDIDELPNDIYFGE